MSKIHEKMATIVSCLLKRKGEQQKSKMEKSRVTNKEIMAYALPGLFGHGASTTGAVRHDVYDGLFGYSRCRYGHSNADRKITRLSCVHLCRQHY